MGDSLKVAPVGVSYVIRRGSEILVHRTKSLHGHQTLVRKALPRDFEAILTTKAVTYIDADVCMLPTPMRLCLSPASDYGVTETSYYNDGEYYGFRLPKNSREAAFILVHMLQVEVIIMKGVAISSVTKAAIHQQEKEFNKNIKKFMDSYQNVKQTDVKQTGLLLDEMKRYQEEWKQYQNSKSFTDDLYKMMKDIKL